MNTLGILREPHSWDDALRGTRPLVRTSLFWACLPAFLLAFIMTGGIAIRVMFELPAKAPLLAPPLFLTNVIVVYIGWRFLGFLREVRALLQAVPEQADGVLSIARWTARLFTFGMMGIGIAMVVALQLRAG